MKKTFAHRLPDGRTLSYETIGPDDGHPVLFFHGTPGSAPNLLLLADEPRARRHGLRILAIDRPGIGHSTYVPRWGMSSFAADLEELCDSLGLSSVSLLSHSCGGPFALATAARFGSRAEKVTLVASPAPDGGAGYAENDFIRLCGQRPRVARAVLRMMALTARFAPLRMLKQAKSMLPEPDQAVLDDPALSAAFFAMVRQALQQGPEGAQHDGGIVYKAWDFDLGKVTSPVTIWHGSLDRNVSVGATETLSSVLPGIAATNLMPDEGHISILVEYADQILAQL